MKRAGLVLEGGGMRGVYTAGVLELFLEKGLRFPYVVGVSAGACNAVSYISGQAGRNKEVTLGYIRDPRYLSFRNLMRERSLFGMDFIFDEIPRKLVPFDYDAFERSPIRFAVGTTDCRTGDTVYFEKGKTPDMMTAVRASSSLPFLSPVIPYEGFALMDGGISDPIPAERSIRDGNERHVFVLTRPAGYVKEAAGMMWVTRRAYRRYPGLVRAIERRHRVYNEQLELVGKLEREGRAVVFRPPAHLKVSRVEKDPERLALVYEQGYRDAEAKFEALTDWLS